MYYPLRNQSGQAMIIMGVGFVAFVAIAAVAVDVAHLALTATEVQTAADAAATAAAATISVSDGQLVAGQNSIGGQPGPTACGEGSSTCIVLGSWDGTTFTPDAVPATAAQATVSVSGVQNILAGMFGQGTSTVTKTAVAAVRPTLPLAMGIGSNCEPDNAGNPAYQPVRFDPPDCTVRPQAIIHYGNSSRSDYLGWANFDYPDGGVNQSDFLQHMPSQCGGGTGAPPVLQSNFNLRQSFLGSLENDLFSCVNNDPPIDSFLIAFFDCDPTYLSTGVAAPQTKGFGVIKVLSIDDPSTTPDPTMLVELRCAGSEVTLVQ